MMGSSFGPSEWARPLKNLRGDIRAALTLHEYLKLVNLLS